MSSVLDKSTAETLHQYEDHVEDVQAEYVPILEVFQTLRPGDCRDIAESILNQTTTLTGFAASNCANNYDNRVRTEINIANRAFVRFDDLYSQVLTIVAKSFIGQNVFLTAEKIEENLSEIYELVQGRWNGSKPELEAVRRNLAAAIAEQNAELGRCHNSNLQNAILFYGMFRSSVQTCLDFDNTQEPFGQVAMAGRSVAPYIEQLQQFEAALAKAETFEWKA